MIELVFEEAVIIAIFVTILYGIETGNMELLYYAIAIVCTVLGTLFGMWKIISHMEEKRDKDIRQLLRSEQEFKDHKASVSHNLMAYSTQFSNAVQRLESTLDRIDRKLDKQNEVISEQEGSLARLDERTKDK